MALLHVPHPIMSRLNSYLDYVDLSALRIYCEEHGVLHRYSKGECFLSEGEKGNYFALVSKGYFKFVVSDSDSDVSVVNFAFEGEFVADLINSFHGCHSEGSIIAGSQSDVYMISYSELKGWCKENMPEFVPSVSSALFRMLYTRYLDGYRMTPKERYIDFIRAYPDVLQIISLKELASYLHITPVYLSRIRKEVHRL